MYLRIDGRNPLCEGRCTRYPKEVCALFSARPISVHHPAHLTFRQWGMIHSVLSVSHLICEAPCRDCGLKWSDM